MIMKGVILMLAAAVAAPSSSRYVQVFNFPAADSCATWTRYRSEKVSQSLEGWVLGFVTGRNFYGTGNVGLGVQAEGLTGWVDQYCAANPLDSVTTAAVKLVNELQKRSKP